MKQRKIFTYILLATFILFNVGSNGTVLATDTGSKQSEEVQSIEKKQEVFVATEVEDRQGAEEQSKEENPDVLGTTEVEDKQNGEEQSKEENPDALGTTEVEDKQASEVQSNEENTDTFEGTDVKDSQSDKLQPNEEKLDLSETNVKKPNESANVEAEVEQTCTPESLDLNSNWSDLKENEETINIKLPDLTESGSSPFDFIMDPYGMINSTNAAKYGGKNFEEGATFYFENTDGYYDYSHHSDWLKVVSRSSVSIKVNIEARINNISAIKLTSDNTFYGDKNPSIYMALVDNMGNLVPLDENGIATICTEMDALEDENSFNVYSFSLVGACNPNGKWDKVDEMPQISVSWTVESIECDETINSEVILDIQPNSEEENNDREKTDAPKDTSYSLPKDENITIDTSDSPNENKSQTIEEKDGMEVIPEIQPKSEEATIE